jgi:Tfp pilus assembly protein PilF
MALAGCETLSRVAPEQALPELSIEQIVAPAAPGTLDLAKRALAERRYGDTEKLLDRVLISDPENPMAKLVMAELMLATGAPQQAAETFEQLLETPEVKTLALQGHGISRMLLGDREKGFESLREAVEEDPTLWRAWNALGYYHDSRRDWAAAAESYGRAIEGNPDSAVVFNNRGFSMLMQKRLDEAISALNRALEIDPDFEVAQENLRLALAWSGKYIHAMSGVSNRDMARVLNNVGYIAVLRGDYGNAEAYLLRAMEVDPSYNEVASRNLSYLKHVRELAKAESQATAN